MSSGSEKTLKSQNMKWLVSLALFDLVVVLLFIAPDLVLNASSMQLAFSRGVASILLPVVVLVLVNILPHDIKAALCYFRVRNILPGCRAFTHYGPKDQRVDMVRLEKNVGKPPNDAHEQNARWYALYRLVRDELPVAEAHRAYLLLRDMATLSFILMIVAPAALYWTGASEIVVRVAGGFFAVQYALTALGGRWNGIRMVGTVLALHSASRIAGSKPK
jgi:hypothetical protein